MSLTRAVARIVARRRARNAGLLDDERGSSMIELVMVLALLSIVLAFVFGAIGSLQAAVTGEDRRTVNVNEGRVLMAAATRDLRTATRLQSGTSAFTTAANTQATFYANLDNGNPPCGPKLVNIFVDAQTRLVEQVTPPDSCAGPTYTYTGASTIRFVGRYVANQGTQPIFTYLDASGNALPATPLSASDRLAIHGVKINLAIRQSTTFKVAATTLVNQVRLPNLDYQQVTG
ncbi:MAG: hypothetical protein JWL73_2809 [Actinomycetia bacterium]|nr:hypothetical protein [Actinomycetes bacterium]